MSARTCDAELCPYWTGEGCACRAFGIDPPTTQVEPGTGAAWCECGDHRADHELGACLRCPCLSYTPVHPRPRPAPAPLSTTTSPSTTPTEET